MFFKNPVTIRTARDVRRTTIICGVAYGEDVDAAREVIAKAVRGVDAVRDDVRDVQIFAQEFADSAINFEVTWWTGSRPVDIRKRVTRWSPPSNVPWTTRASRSPSPTAR